MLVLALRGPKLVDFLLVLEVVQVVSMEWTSPGVDGNIVAHEDLVDIVMDIVIDRLGMRDRAVIPLQNGTL